MEDVCLGKTSHPFHLSLFWPKKKPQKAFEAKFKPTPERLKEIGKKGLETMESLTPEDIGKLSELPPSEKP